ncbi:hypothetical protein PR003_g12745 [Phytophthora rubi]|uniref:Uncharacterized protein n=1 Tax=Phytophthora rubi TaxID=129364 RepID=A0A6A4EZF8_9STRA|nr:hypothetical protein PR003_g12745 [Phytophthora rubi]
MATQEAQEGPPGGKDEIDGEEVETDDTGEELVEENDEGEEEDDTGKEVKEEENCDDGEGMDAGSEDVEEGDDGEDGEDMVEEGDADAENADATADDDADENMVGGATITPGLSRISTHNHKTTKTIFESYKGAKSMPLTTKVRQDLGLMTEIKTSTEAISRYLLDKLDMVLSPQQTRNILQQDCCWIRLSELMIMAFC